LLVNSTNSPASLFHALASGSVFAALFEARAINGARRRLIEKWIRVSMIAGFLVQVECARCGSSVSDRKLR
jgi:hypothetical protein